MDNTPNLLDPSELYGLPSCPNTGCMPMPIQPAQMQPSPQPQMQPSLQQQTQPISQQPQVVTRPSPYPQQPPQVTLVGNTPGNPDIPTLEEIANYNYLNAQQRREQREQLLNAGYDELQQMLQREPPDNLLLPQNNMQTTPQQQAGSQNPLQPITPSTQPPPITGESLQYLNGFMRTQIGRIVQVQFLVGTNTIIDRMGVLLAVGANYILINELQTDDILACDFYNIKFIRFYY